MATSLADSCPRNHQPVVRTRAGCVQCGRERAREWRLANPARSRQNSRRWASENPDSYLDARLRRDYGISLQEYLELESAQESKCASCGEPEPTRSRLAVDHDHSTGRVRGLLCTRCNVALGMLRDDPHVIEALRHYLLRAK